MKDIVATGNPYNCNAEKVYLETQKITIDYHTKHVGNPSKSTMTSAELEKMKQDYDFLKAKYEASECGKDPDRDKCLSYQSQMGSLRSTISYFLAIRDVKQAKILESKLDELMIKYKDLNCDAKISQYRGGVVMSISDVFQQMDKERIEEETKYKFRQKLFFGGIVIFGALLIVTTFSKKK
jgi:hypothetical protein